MNPDKHRQIAEKNLATWRQKNLLREVYKGFFREITPFLHADASRPTVELGSGVCGIKEVIPDCICTDLFMSTGVDQVESVYDLSFAPESIANFIMIDVFHHLQYSFAALENIRQKLSTNGRLVIFEPAMSLLGLLVYGLLHEEPIALFDKIDTRKSPPSSAEIERYYAAQGNASRVFGGRKYSEHMRGWRVITRRRYSSLSYIASGGFKTWQLYPTSCLSAMRGIDSALGILPSVFATRQMIVLEKN